MSAARALDALLGSSDSKQPAHSWRGDLLCLLASVFYAISNVGQEATVKRFEDKVCLRARRSRCRLSSCL
jgi:hypothetical protein